ncbi:alpha/beta fold hydrolase [Sulfuriflexus mobilis]|uniref:alpha/beta fold hydrolase n=1 Tax=Sulfuriflexus mobilis TaxID=1811807 RepID=UPI000F839663|nr:alpha/beta fold hydrolase [Sulfuriflexus mobilis]
MTSTDEAQRRARRKGHHRGHVQLWLLRRAFRYLGPLFPRQFGRLAHWLWTRTHRYPEPARERRMRLRASECSLQVNDQSIAAWRWGQGPLVLLVHGWNGRGMQMAGFVDTLLKSGYQVMTFDAPGHGLSPGRHSSLLQVRDVILAIAERRGPVHAVIAHSFGVACVAAAIREGLESKAIIAISAPGGYESLLKGYTHYLSMPASVTTWLRDRLRSQVGTDFWQQLQLLPRPGQALPQTLVIHDRDDQTVDWRIGEALARSWPQADLFLTEGLGHRRILLSGKVARQATAFLDGIAIGDEFPHTEK